MPGLLPEDTLDYSRTLEPLTRLLSSDDPMYRCAVEVARRTCRAKSCQTYVAALRRFFTWTKLKGVDPLAATPDDLSDWLASLARYSASSKQLAVTVVRLLYDEAMERDLVVRSPARRLRVRRSHADAGPPGLTQERRGYAPL